MKQGAIFDMDGLMFDTERLWQKGWRELARVNGYKPSLDFAREIMGTSGELMAKVIRKYYPSVDPGEFSNACRKKVEEALAVDVPVKEGLYDILNFFRDNKVQMAVASSSPIPMIKRNLASADVEEYFRVVVSSKEVARPKPEPDVFLEAAKRLGIAPEDCYVFEDSFGGIKAGVAAGCTTVMIPDQVPPTDEIEAMCAGIYENLHIAARAIYMGEV